MNRFFSALPIFLQNCVITIYNTYQYKIRHSGCYSNYFDYFSKSSLLSKEEIEIEKEKRLKDLLEHALNKSDFYSALPKGSTLERFPILNKEDIVSDLKNIATIKECDAVVSLTGGTTGSSMKVLYTKENIQERHALLDHFRSQYGYKLGKRCAWFSGKNIATSKDVINGNCYRDDYINKIRFFSTFHITEKNFDSYWSAFTQFAPEYIVGFPSSVYELCAMAKSRGLSCLNKVVAFFPTAETLLPIHREVIKSVLGCKIADQYASSEGAPFILECEHGGLHIHPLSGVFEVVDDDLQPSQEGEILVTSFTTWGTPLIRYRIGDRLKLSSSQKCMCGSEFTLVDKIEGRNTDYILSPDNGKVNLGNISNATKDIKGIIMFQVLQDDINEVDVNVVCNSYFDNKEQDHFKEALIERFGGMKVNIYLVKSIPKEKSGKFRIVKNNLV
ncbi:phenylacetate--CoA ligase family protein [Pseudoalteromonas sp. MB47]|uniref:phenylacetate--CoA ligase family protein n=1 Tax=Pseudoalteromonas sp. MB47 TaxID=2588452 RepID=UPI00140A6B75|nr:phenylacetate--CoA ligase family protein [Pseudoalteromonas sp. MB47]NHH89284.1 Phenylacetate-coenzyme A ligase [Pseudoalteromonas sp. MB47]